MTATAELRRLLDERGVEWDYGIAGATTTRFTVNGVDLTFTPMRDGLVCSTILTPAQAIEATLGRKEYVYALTAIDPEDGREYMLGIYATRELVEKSIETNERGYALHYVSRWEVVGE